MKESDNFNLNMEALSERFPEQAYLIENSVWEKKFWEEEPAGSGDPTAFFTENGKKKYIHSKYDPAHEALKKAEKLETGQCVVVQGVGLGYILDVLAKKIDSLGALYIFERHPSLMASAFRRSDYSTLICHEKTSVSLAYHPEDIDSKDFEGPATVIRNSPLVEHDPEYYQWLDLDKGWQTVVHLPGRRENSYNLVLICKDSLRRDRLGIYGAPVEACPTPNIDRFFSDGFKMDAYSVSSWTPTVIASVFTARMPWEHNIVCSHAVEKSGHRVNIVNDIFKGPCNPLAKMEKMKILVSSNPWIHSQTGFDRGFHFSSVTRESWKGDFVNAEIMEYEKLMRNSGFFLFAHYMDTHYPYAAIPGLEPDEEAISSFYPSDETPDPSHNFTLTKENTIYNSSVMAADCLFGELIDWFEKTGLLENTVVVLFSDHGEELRDHGTLNYPRHGHTLYNELIHVPLLIHVPPAMKDWAAQNISPLCEEPFNLINLVPFASAVCERKKIEPQQFSYPFIGFLGRRETKLISLITDVFKVVVNLSTEETEVYNIEIDPAETDDISSQFPDIVAKGRQLRKVVLDILPPGIFDRPEGIDDILDEEEFDEIQARLTELGYM